MSEKLTTEKVRSLLEESTPGEWRPHRFADGSYGVLAEQGVSTLGDEAAIRVAKDELLILDDARLTAAAPDLARAYLAQAEEVERLRALAPAPARKSPPTRAGLCYGGGARGVREA